MLRPRAHRLLFVASLLLPFSTSAFAVPEVFGPATYVIQAGAPQTFTATVSTDETTLCNGLATFVLSMQNNGVSSGTVSLNGVGVFRENDFRLNLPAIERPVHLGASNTLEIQLNGGHPGNSITLTVRRDIEEPVTPPATYTLAGTHGSFEASFAVADASNTFHVIVENGDQSGLHRIKSAAVILNGATVVSENEVDVSSGMVRKPVTLQNENRVTVDLKGDAGDFVTVSFKSLLEESACGPTVKIVAPAAGTIVNDARIVVRGTVTGRGNVGVNVNGFIADVLYGAAGTEADPLQWVAAVKADEGTVELKGVATNDAGAQGHAERTILFAPDPANFDVTAIPRSGIAPLTVQFRASAPGDVAHVEIDYDGDGTVDYAGAEFPATMQYVYSGSGLRVAKMTVTRPGGQIGTGSVPVMIQSLAGVDAILQKEWSAFADALAAGDIARAMRFLAGDETRAKYGPLFTIIRPRLSSFAAAIRDIHAVYVKGRLADYLVIRDENGAPHGYHVYFMPDSNGLWRIVQF